jgi:hypothetical protein
MQPGKLSGDSGRLVSFLPGIALTKS